MVLMTFLVSRIEGAGFWGSDDCDDNAWNKSMSAQNDINNDLNLYLNIIESRIVKSEQLADDYCA